MAVTARGALPTPDDADPADVPVDMAELATQLAALFAMYDYGVAAGRPAADAAHEGMVYLTTDGTEAGKLEFCNGSAWLPIPIKDGTMLRGEVRQMRLRDTTETVQAYAGVTGARALDLSLANVFHINTMVGNTTFSFTNVPASGAASVTVITKQDATGGRTHTWPGTVDWPGATAPTPTVSPNAVNVYEFLTVDGGVTWLGWLAGGGMG